MYEDLIGLKVSNSSRGLKKFLEAHYPVRSVMRIGENHYEVKLQDSNSFLIYAVPIKQPITHMRIIDVSELDR